MTKGYQGHPSRAYWNVALWIGNDEGLYRRARSHIRLAPNREAAARNMMAELEEMSVRTTPDGYAYSAAKIRHAMKGL